MMNRIPEKIRTRIANTIYQLLWFGFYSRSYDPAFPIGSVRIEKYMESCIPRFQRQISLAKAIAKFFNVKILTLIGDSNSAVFTSFYSAIRFQAVTITLGIPGTRPDQWVKFFYNDLAKDLTKELILIHEWNGSESGIMVWNIGGNSVLQKSMGNAKLALEALRELFPFSFNILIPPIHSWILDKVPNDIDYDQDIELINSYIINEWHLQAINLRPIFANPITGDSWYGYLSDPVHYSSKGKRIITRTLNWVLGLF